MTEHTSNQDNIKDVTTETPAEALAEEAVLTDENRLADLTQEELITEFEQLEKKTAENWDKAVRAQAELENVRRRAERDVAAAHKYGSEKLLKDLLPVVDSLTRGLESCDAGDDGQAALREGMEMTLKILLETLEKHGVKQINPEGEPFNPEEMEAVSMLPNAEVEPNTVLNVVQTGFKLNERLIRPAMVVVSQA